MKKLVREKPIVVTSVPKSFAMAGNPGRYMSMENGPSAVSAPKIKIKKKNREGDIVVVVNGYLFYGFRLTCQR